jgi:hypothetical protein
VCVKDKRIGSRHGNLDTFSYTQSYSLVVYISRRIYILKKKKFPRPTGINELISRIVSAHCVVAAIKMPSSSERKQHNTKPCVTAFHLLLSSIVIAEHKSSSV